MASIQLIKFQVYYQLEYNESYVKWETKVYGGGRTNPPPPQDIDIVKGSAYGAFSRGFVDFILTDPAAKDLLLWSRTTWSPDEFYWSTLNHKFANPHLHAPGAYSGRTGVFVMQRLYNGLFHKTVLSLFLSFSVS